MRRALVALGAFALVAWPPVPSAAGACDYATAPYTLQQAPVHGLGGFSPDGSRAIVSRGGDELYVVSLDTMQVERTIALPAGTGAALPFWTARGWIVSSARRTEPGAGVHPVTPPPLFAVRPDGSGFHRLAYPPGTPAEGPGRYWGGLHVSPDGTKVLLTRIEPGSWVIWRLDVEETPSGLALTGPRVFLRFAQYGEVKGFSDDGQRVVVASSRGQGDGDKSLNADVFVADWAGELRRLTSAPTWDEDADVRTGDGGPQDALVFISDRDTPNPYHVYYSVPAPNQADWGLVASAVLPLYTWTSHELFVAGGAGDAGWVRRLTFDYDPRGPAGEGWVARSPLWSPDGRRVAFLQQRQSQHWNWNYLDPGAWRVMLLTFAC